MGATSTISSGKDGILRLTSTKEIPMLTDWTLNGIPASTGQAAPTMKSNADATFGTSGTSAYQWAAPEVSGRGWSIDAAFFWQRGTSGAAPELDATQVGIKIGLTLFPVEAPGWYYSGEGFLSRAAVVGATNEKIKQTINIIGTGPLKRDFANSSDAQTLIDGVNITYDATVSLNAKVTLGTSGGTSGATLAAVANAADGATGHLTITQDIVGSRPLNLAANYKVVSGSAEAIASQSANKQSYLTWVYRSGANEFDTWISQQM